MTIAKKLKAYLDNAGVRYETVAHSRTSTASENAQSVHVPGDCVAKTVVIHHEAGYVLAVVPSSHRVDLTELQGMLDRRLGLANENDIETLFDDCETGAATPIGAAYGVQTVIDTRLTERDEVWFEGGDHRTLVQVTGPEFDRLMKDAMRGEISYHM